MILATPYYPEHWPQERWKKDAELMEKAGIKRIRMGEFAWHKMEPEPGSFSFEWLKEVIDLFAEHGIKTILCTPTPTYPAWLHKKCPDIHQIKSDGTVKEFGQRQDACKNHPDYRKYAYRITKKMLQELGGYPNVIAWQTDNEFGCHGTVRCYCDYCEEAFQEWLKERFDHDIDKLNSSWGTFFWSQTYNNFNEISLPRDTADRTGNGGQNPGLVLDFYRFSSEVQVQFQKEQIELIKEYAPDCTVTHNLMGLFSDIDYFDLSEDLDIVSWDNYPFAINGTNQPPPPLAHDLMRGLKQQNVWVMEQASGPGGWGTFAATPQPGQMRLWAYQAVARGADMISFFRWRSCRFGREQFWHGILNHHGQPQRRYEEVKQIGNEFEKIKPELENTTVESKIGILYDYSSLWSLESQPQVEEGFGYIENAQRFDKAVSGLGLTAEATGIDSDLSRYNILFAPSQHILTEKSLAKIKDYVKNGGIIIFGPRSGVKDKENAVVNEYLPGKLKELCGCYVEEYDAFSNIPELDMKVRDDSSNIFDATGLAEILVPDQEKSEGILFYDNHYYSGKPAAVTNKIENGKCIYMGTVLEEKGYKHLLINNIIENIIEQNNVDIKNRNIYTNLSKPIEIVTRSNSENTYTFYLNHSSKAQNISLRNEGTDIITGEKENEEIQLAGFDLKIIKEV